MTTWLFWIPIALYLVGWLGESLRYWWEPGDRLPWSRGMLAVGWGAHSLLVVALGLESGINLAVLLIAAAWLAIGLYYAIMQRRASAVFPLIFPPFAIALLITAFFTSGRDVMGPQALGLTLPATRNILTAHIVTVLAGILLFGLGCLMSILYLVQEHRLKSKLSGLAESRLPSLGALEGYNHKAITLGFFFMTLGLLLGLVVAGLNTLPHRMFSARQIIPTLVWVVYAIFLMAHDLQGRRGRFGAIWSIAGFAVVVTSLIFEIIFLTTRA